MRVRIYKPARNAMQSGIARTRGWVLVYPAADAREIDPLMGWTSSDDTQSQISLRFETRKQAEDYAREMGLADKAISPSSFVVLTPDRRPEGRVQVFHDVALGVEYLRYARQASDV